MITINDVKEVPYALYDKNINNDALPVSVVVIPNEAIKIANVHARSRIDYNMFIYKCIFTTFIATPVTLVIISFFVRMP
jgi:hypothetical protein